MGHRRTKVSSRILTSSRRCPVPVTLVQWVIVSDLLSDRIADVVIPFNRFAWGCSKARALLRIRIVVAEQRVRIIDACPPAITSAIWQRSLEWFLRTHPSR